MCVNLLEKQQQQKTDNTERNILLVGMNYHLWMHRKTVSVRLYL